MFMGILAPHLAPQLAGKITFLKTSKEGVGGKNSRASVASYPTLTFFLKSILEYLLSLQVHFL